MPRCVPQQFWGDRASLNRAEPPVAWDDQSGPLGEFAPRALAANDAAGVSAQARDQQNSGPAQEGGAGSSGWCSCQVRRFQMRTYSPSLPPGAGATLAYMVSLNSGAESEAET